MSKNKWGWGGKSTYGGNSSKYDSGGSNYYGSDSYWDNIFSWRPKRDVDSVVNSNTDISRLKNASKGIKAKNANTEGVDKVDEYMIQDMYDIFYNKDYQVKLKEDQSNWWWYKILSKFDNYQLKPLTNSSNIFSYMVSNHMTQHLIEMFKEMDPEEMKDELQQSAPGDDEGEDGDGQGSGSGDGDGSEQGEGQSDSGSEGNGNDGTGGKGAGKGNSNGPKQSTDSTIRDGSPSQGKFKSKAENLAEKTAQKAMDSLQDFLDKNKEAIDEYEEYQKDAGSQEAAIDFAEMEKLKQLNNQIGLNKGHIDAFVKQSIKNFSGYFDTMSKSQTESMLDADVINDLVDMELALIDPIFLDLVDNKFFSSKKKFDVYIDVLN